MRALLAPGDGWSAAVAPAAPADPGEVSVLRIVLEPDLGARPAQHPPWLAHVRTLTRREHREAYAALRALFDALGEAVPRAVPVSQSVSDSGSGSVSGSAAVSTAEPGAHGRPLLVCHANTAAAVNVVWAAVELLGNNATPMLGQILDRALAEPWALESGRLRNACTKALVELDTEESTDALITAAACAPTKALKEQLLLCVDLAKHRTEQPASKVAELHVPDHGLSGAGRLTLSTHHHEYMITLLPDGQVTVEDRSADATPDQAAQRILDTQVRAIRATYRKERMRLEALLATERTWTYAEWRRVYQDNPIARAVASRLVWRHEFADGRVLEVLPDANGGVDHTRLSGTAPSVSRARDGSTAFATAVTSTASAASAAKDQMPTAVTLWHPRDAGPAALAAWRAIRDDRRLTQPFEQIDRDFTRVEPDPDALELKQHSPAEVDTAAFEAALPLLDWHSRRTRAGRSADAVRVVYRDFPDTRLCVSAPCREGGATVVLGAAWFHRAEDRARTPLPLGYVPPRVYSEALRDLAVLARGAHPADTDVQGILEL